MGPNNCSKYRDWDQTVTVSTIKKWDQTITVVNNYARIGRQKKHKKKLE